ncbi:PAAR domain-containing protein (plasmid) [Paraburkholderia sprentiae WSM5005]|uniref:PAAR domain-containing protein n=1 Tax=Paraburkholderia sprentiae WSM5005 TaxID=754502 RepID=A0A1I9YUY2_9BURK|nr:PAAR domain-containing protein [Paraburkholderia sprentiae]APA90020.1 PAAR domain-containing protein [Paraburkholderia sprentiae WSM5005]
MYAVVRKGDPIGDGGSVVGGSPSVFVNGIPAGLVGISSVVCSLHPSAQSLVAGSGSVFINGVPAAIVGGCVSCGSALSVGSPDVLIGE